MSDIISNNCINLSVFSSEGRLGRIRYLAYAFGLALASGVISGVSMVLLGGGLMAAATSGAGGLATGGLVTIIVLALMLATLVVSIILMIKRLHDMDWSGWLVLLMLLPIVNFVLALLLIFKPGTQGANRYGAQTPPNGVLVTIVGLAIPVVWAALVAFGIVTMMSMMSGLDMDAAQMQQMQQQMQQLQQQQQQMQPAPSAPANQTNQPPAAQP